MKHKIQRFSLLALVITLVLSGCVATVPPVVGGNIYGAQAEQPDNVKSDVESDVKSDVEIIEVQVSENMFAFSFDESKAFEDGMPAYGSTFITGGYLYEAGTLDGANGVNADGSPEFPDKVIGEWFCRGWFIGDGMRTESGSIVITTQLLKFNDGSQIVTEGHELIDFDVPVTRVITGGSGKYVAARGQAEQALIGLNATEGVVLEMQLAVQK